MLQERTGNKKDDSKKDLIFIVLIVLVIVFIRRIFSFFSTLSMPWNTILQGLLFAALVAGCYLFFTKRVSDYRYSVIYRQPAEGEKNIFGDEQQYPWQEGTVLFERMIANKGRLNETVEPSELVWLGGPGTIYEEKISTMRTEHFSGKPRRQSHTLVYRRKSKLYQLIFSPSEQMIGHIQEAIASNQTR